MKTAPLLVAALAAAGCAGASSHVRADASRYPVSMSGSVRDGAGRIVAPSRLERVGGYGESYTSWAMIWTIVPLANRTYDVSEALNAQVQASRGDAVVNFTAIARPCASNIFTIVGVLPGCTDVELSGDIVRVRPETSTAPSAAPVEGVEGKER